MLEAYEFVSMEEGGMLTCTDWVSRYRRLPWDLPPRLNSFLRGPRTGRTQQQIGCQY